MSFIVILSRAKDPTLWVVLSEAKDPTPWVVLSEAKDLIKYMNWE